MSSESTSQANRVQASLRRAPISPSKIKLIAEQIRGKQAQAALDILQFTPKKAAVLMAKLVSSAMSNAEQNQGIDADDLYVSRVDVGSAGLFKRTKARARGRANRIQKRSSHIAIELQEVA